MGEEMKPEDKNMLDTLLGSDQRGTKWEAGDELIVIERSLDEKDGDDSVRGKVFGRREKDGTLRMVGLDVVYKTGGGNERVIARIADPLVLQFLMHLYGELLGVPQPGPTENSDA